MAHALRRVSYATCEPSQSSFSFLARQPKGHFTQQFCHAFLAKSSEQRREGCEMGRTSGGGALFRVHHQYRKLREEPHPVDLMAYPCTRCGHLQTFKAEELNSIVGNAFRMAYAAQLQPAFQQVMQNNQQHQQTTPSEQQSFLWNRPGSLDYGMKGGNSLESGLPGTVPEEADSPTELNSCRRIADKPPPVKRLAMGTTPTEEELPPPLIITTKSIDIHDRLTDSAETKTSGATPPPAPPERSDSLNNRPEDGELKSAPWFQAGIPREITLEVLGQEPVGSFMVRESTSKPGCFALSLRVPHEFQPLGIAHYLILRTNKGYKIKGFTKEFRTLTALITHHSVMPELLPCPLSLSRYNPTYSQADTSRDFADIDSDPDYNTLADFRRMMADLNV